MNPRILVGLVGVVTTVLGVVGLVYPAQVMRFSSLAPFIPTEPAATYGEIRAIYGGVLIALGAWTLLAATNPWRHRAVVNLVASVWLCVFVGRMVGVTIDGGPGVIGWLNAVLELTAGVALLAVPVLGASPEGEVPTASAAAPEPS